MKLNDSNLFRQQALINGEWLDANNGEVIDVTNPANGDKLGSVPKMGADETRAAIDAANRALPAWRALTAKERANILRNWFNLMMEHQDDLARLMTLEQGKPLAEAKGEISYAASFIEWFAEEGKRIYGDTIPGHQADKRLIVIKQPIGVTAAITPWNFPAAMITRKAGPALAAGCTMVLKPASQTPFSALALAELAIRAGVPAGVFNVVTGSAGAVGNELTSNPLVRKLSFTGSTEIGRQLMEQCAKDIKKVSLELGGNAPFIVFDDADLDKAVEGALCDEHGIMLIADEVQSGAGRTGTLFAMEQMGVAPDLTTFAKSIAGGFPLAGVTGRAEVMDAVAPGGLGGTYAGNPIACVAALEVLKVFEQENLLQKANDLGHKLKDGLLAIAEKHPEIGDIRGLGAMIAIELFEDGDHSKPDAKLTAEIVARARDKGLILLSCGPYYNVLRILVPLTIEDAQIRQGLEIISQCFAEAKQ